MSKRMTLKSLCPGCLRQIMSRPQNSFFLLTKEGFIFAKYIPVNIINIPKICRLEINSFRIKTPKITARGLCNIERIDTRVDPSFLIAYKKAIFATIPAVPNQTPNGIESFEIVTKGRIIKDITPLNTNNEPETVSGSTRWVR